MNAWYTKYEQDFVVVKIDTLYAAHSTATLVTVVALV